MTRSTIENQRALQSTAASKANDDETSSAFPPPLIPKRGSSMSAFHRNKSSNSRSFALRAFNQCETEINQHFWSFKVISEHAGFIARGLKKTNASYSTSAAFHASGPDAMRIPTTVSEWLGAQVALENWLRLSALVSAAAFHEAYLRQIVRSALLAAPIVRLGQPDLIDGVVLLKVNAEFDYEDEVVSITKGSWQARSGAFDRLFGTSSIPLFPISDLEEVRKLRNDFAHGFGRDLNIPAPSIHTVVPSQRLSQQRFLQLLGTLSKCAKAVDRYILSSVIGDFEMVHAFHIWLQDNRGRFGNDKELARAFQSYSAGTLGASRSSAYCNELLLYYRSA